MFNLQSEDKVWKISFHRRLHWIFSPLTLLKVFVSRKFESRNICTQILNPKFRTKSRFSKAMCFLAQFICISPFYSNNSVLRKNYIAEYLCIAVICGSYFLSCKEYFLNALTFHSLCSTWVPHSLRYLFSQYWGERGRSR